MAQQIAFINAMSVDIAPMNFIRSAPSSSPLYKAAQGFWANVYRAMTAIALPSSLANWVSLQRYAELVGNFTVLGNPVQPDQLDAEKELECVSESLRIYHELLPRQPTVTTEREGLEVAGNMLGAFMGSGLHAGDGLLSILSSSMIGLWTAFEIFSGDLWEDAINYHPAKLSQLKGRKEGKDDMKLDLNYVHKHNYDLSKTMGTLLKHRYKFTNLQGIKSAYQHAFHCDFKDIDDLIDPEMESLECARNLLVHSGGIVDQQFLDRTKNLPTFSGIGLGIAIPVNGHIVATFLGATTHSAAALLLEVDEWLKAH
jgi:hypothetical protein